MGRRIDKVNGRLEKTLLRTTRVHLTADIWDLPDLKNTRLGKESEDGL